MATERGREILLLEALFQSGLRHFHNSNRVINLNMNSIFISIAKFETWFSDLAILWNAINIYASFTLFPTPPETHGSLDPFFLCIS